MSKYFRIDPRKVFKRMYGFETIDHHNNIFDSIENYDNTVVAATRRGGKTKTAAAAVIAKFLEPKSEIMVLAPQHSLTDNIFFNNVWRFLRDNNIETKRANFKDRIIEGTNGSIIYARSLQKAVSIVGVGLNLAVLDEIALTNDSEFWEQELQPTLADKGGHTLWISTPRGLNHFKEKFDYGRRDDFPDWNSYTYTFWDLPYIPEERKKRLEQSYIRAGKEAYWRQEYLASFESFEGQIYSRSPDIEAFDKDIEWDMVIGGLDVGYNHNTAFVVFGIKDDQYYMLDYYMANKKTTQEHADKIKEMENQYKIDIIFIDHAAAQFAWDFVAMHDITTMPADKHVLEGIARCQTLIAKGDIKIHSSLWAEDSELRAQFSVYQWDDTKEKPVKLRDDLMDAFRYAIYTFDTRYFMRSTAILDEEGEKDSD